LLERTVLRPAKVTLRTPNGHLGNVGRCSDRIVRHSENGRCVANIEIVVMLLLRAGVGPNIAEEKGSVLISEKPWDRIPAAVERAPARLLFLGYRAESASTAWLGLVRIHEACLHRAKCGICLLFAFYANRGARTRSYRNSRGVPVSS
jgi:hypothetical protein